MRSPLEQVAPHWDPVERARYVVPSCDGSDKWPCRTCGARVNYRQRCVKAHYETVHGGFEPPADAAQHGGAWGGEDEDASREGGEPPPSPLLAPPAAPSGPILPEVAASEVWPERGRGAEGAADLSGDDSRRESLASALDASGFASAARAAAAPLLLLTEGGEASAAPPLSAALSPRPSASLSSWGLQQTSTSTGVALQQSRRTEDAEKRLRDATLELFLASFPLLKSKMRHLSKVGASTRRLSESQGRVGRFTHEAPHAPRRGRLRR